MKDIIKKTLSVLTLVTIFGFTINVKAAAVNYKLDALKTGDLIICGTFIPGGVSVTNDMVLEAAATCSESFTAPQAFRFLAMMSTGLHDYSGTEPVLLKQSEINAFTGGILEIYKEWDVDAENFATANENTFLASLSATHLTYPYNITADSQIKNAIITNIAKDASIVEGTSITVEFNPTADSPSTGVRKVDVTLKLNGQMKSYTSQTLTKERYQDLTLAMTKNPNKLIYSVGEEVNLAGAEFTLTGVAGIEKLSESNLNRLTITPIALTGSSANPSIEICIINPTLSSDKKCISTLKVNVLNDTLLINAKTAKINELNALVAAAGQAEDFTESTWADVANALKAAIEGANGVYLATSIETIEKITSTGGTSDQKTLYTTLTTKIANLETKKDYDDSLVSAGVLTIEADTYLTKEEVAIAIKELQDGETNANDGYNTLANAKIVWDEAIATITLNNGTEVFNLTDKIDEINNNAIVAKIKAEANRTAFLSGDGTGYDTKEDAEDAILGITAGYSDAETLLELVAVDDIEWTNMTANLKLPDETVVSFRFTNIKEYTYAQDLKNLVDAAKLDSFLNFGYANQNSALNAITALRANGLPIKSASGWTSAMTYTIQFDSLADYNLGTPANIVFVFTNIVDKVTEAQVIKDADDAIITAWLTTPGNDTLIRTNKSSVENTILGLPGLTNNPDSIKNSTNLFEWGTTTLTGSDYGSVTLKVNLNTGSKSIVLKNITAEKQYALATSFNNILINASKDSNFLNPYNGYSNAADVRNTGFRGLFNDKYSVSLCRDDSNATAQAYCERLVEYFVNQRENAYKVNSINSYIFSTKLIKITNGVVGDQVNTPSATPAFQTTGQEIFFKFVNINNLVDADRVIKDLALPGAYDVYERRYANTAEIISRFKNSSTTYNTNINVTCGTPDTTNICTFTLNDGSTMKVAFAKIDTIQSKINFDTQMFNISFDDTFLQTPVATPTVDVAAANYNSATPADVTAAKNYIKTRLWTKANFSAGEYADMVATITLVAVDDTAKTIEFKIDRYFATPITMTFENVVFE